MEIEYEKNPQCEDETSQAIKVAQPFSSIEDEDNIPLPHPEAAQPFYRKKEKVDFRLLRRLLMFFHTRDKELFGTLMQYYKANQNYQSVETVFTEVHDYFGRKARVGIGRIYGYTFDYYNGSYRYLSLGSMSHRLRELLAQDHYLNLDLQNAHPSILLSLLSKVSIVEGSYLDGMPDLSALKRYVTDRNGVLQILSEIFDFKGK